MIDVGKETLAALMRFLAARLRVLHRLFEFVAHSDVVECGDTGRNVAPARVDDAHFGKAAVAIGSRDGDIVFTWIAGQTERLADQFD